MQGGGGGGGGQVILGTSSGSILYSGSADARGGAGDTVTGQSGKLTLINPIPANTTIDPASRFNGVLPLLNSNDARAMTAMSLAQFLPSGGGGGGGAGGPGLPSVFPSCESFDSYATSGFPCATASPDCSGQNAWSLWYTNEPGGPQNASVSTAQSFSAPNSLRLSPFSDITRTGMVSSGKWIVKAMVMFPSAATGSPRQVYFCVMNGYGGWNADNWSVQVCLDGSTTGPQASTVRTDLVATPPPPPAVTNILPLLFDQWVELRAEIDLGADTYNVYYNNQLLLGQYPYSTITNATTGRKRIACVDIYSNGADGLYIDDVCVQPAPASCYANCDNSTVPPVLNANDFQCFLNRYAAGDSYANCDGSTVPPVLNANDFQCFLNAYAAGCS
jgi:hypothetical protein